LPIAPSAGLAALLALALPLRPGLVAEYSDGERRVVEVVSRAAFSLAGDESIHPALSSRFDAVFSGVLLVLEGGRFFFPGPARVSVGGEEAGEAGLELPTGEHAIRIEIRRPDGAVAYRALWRGDGFDTEPIPPSVLFHRDPPPDLARFEEIERGRDLAEALRCGACHAGLDARRAPDLSRAGERLRPEWIERWLEDPRAFRADATMPALLPDARDRRDVAAYLARLAPEGGGPKVHAADAERERRGREAIESVGCAACHAEGSLGRQGDKTDAASLARYLLDPRAIDPEGAMPALFRLAVPEGATGEERTAFLASEDDLALDVAHALVAERSPAGPPPFEPGDPRRGEEIALTRGCLACHDLEPEPAARQRALALTDADLGFDGGEFEIAGPFPGDVLEPIGDGFEPFPGRDGELCAIFPDADGATAFFRRTISASRPVRVAFSVEVDDVFDLAIDGRTVLSSSKNNVGRPATIEVDVGPGRHAVLLRAYDVRFAWRIRFSMTALLSRALANALVAPPFGRLDAARGCLADAVPGTVPEYSLGSGERAALRAFLAARRETPDRSAAPVHAFRREVRALRCTACHALDAEGPTAALRETPPPLTVAGEKMRASWLESVLVGTRRVRPWMGIRMPKFAEARVRPLVRGLAAHAGVEPGEGEPEREPSRDDRLAGLALLGRSEYSCLSCHDYKEFAALGTRGPDLRFMHARIRPEWFRAWMREPARLISGTSMPRYFAAMDLEETRARIEELRAALSLGENLPPPEGIGGGATATIHARRPIVLRTFLPDASPAAIAIGLEKLVSCAFDTLDCRLLYAWEGDFLDMAPAWAQKGETLPKLLGHVFFRSGKSGLALRVGDPARAAAYRYRGHAMTAKGPEIFFTADGVGASVRFAPLADRLGIRLDYRVSSLDAPLFLAGADGVACEGAEREGDVFRVTRKEFTVTIAETAR